MIEIIGQIGEPATQEEIDAFLDGEEDEKELPGQMDIEDFPDVMP